MAVLYTPHFIQFFDNNGDPLAGGKLYTYAAGTTTPKATYTTAAGNIENANPVVLDAYGRAVLFIEGAYRFDLFTSADVLVKSTDNVTSFNASTATNEGFENLFTGDGETVAFTLTENLGTDEKALFVFATKEYTTNGKFSSDTAWTKGSGWTIAAGVATATGAISTALEQSASQTLVEGVAYSVKYTITRSAGTITLSLGGTAGTARSASGTYSETIIAGSTQTISFGTSGFTGTVDNVTITRTAGAEKMNASDFTINGTALTFAKAPAASQIQVLAPYTLIGAAGAAQVAADAAIAAQAAAELAETNAETAEANAEAALAAIEGLDATSTTSLAIGTGGKSFTIQSGKGFIAGMWILATSDADPTNYMHGYVSSYSGTTLVMVSTNVGGSGTHADWTLRLSGTRGAQGATGSIADITAQTTATAAGGDFFVFADINDGNATKKSALQDIDAGLMGSGAATDGQVLTADGAGGAAWETLNVSSGWVPIKTVTASNSTTVDFVNGSGGVVLDSTYKAYAVVYSHITPATDAQDFRLRVSTNTGSSYATTNYSCRIASTDGAASFTFSNDSTGFKISSAVGNDAADGENTSGIVYLSNLSSTTMKKQVWGNGSNLTASNGESIYLFGGHYDSLSAIDAIRFIFASGNIASGTFTLYGLKDA